MNLIKDNPKSQKHPSISIIIPTLNAADRIALLIEKLLNQTYIPEEIIVVDSSSDDDTAAIAEYSGAQVVSIKREDFNHGLTRHNAAIASSGDFIAFLTDDAIPENNNYLELLIAPLLADDSIAMASGRQIAKSNARKFEKMVREYNYTSESWIRSSEALSKYGIKTFFVSNSCSIYRRSAYMDVGGFKYVNTNEDMLIAASFISNGWKVAYCSEAKVLHSHNFSLKEQFQRNKEIGVFLEEHADDLMNVKETSSGLSLVKNVCSRLMADNEIIETLTFLLDCGARISGNRIGHLKSRIRNKNTFTN